MATSRSLPNPVTTRTRMPAAVNTEIHLDGDELYTLVSSLMALQSPAVNKLEVGWMDDLDIPWEAPSTGEVATACERCARPGGFPVNLSEWGNKGIWHLRCLAAAAQGGHDDIEFDEIQREDAAKLFERLTGQSAEAA
jgi:hypothetical protein